MDCLLKYIPQRLHTNEKSTIEEFVIGEKLFYRCKYEEIKRPYDKIPLYDISHNRDFKEPNKYPKGDVLYNIIETDSREVYNGVEVITLEIKELKKGITYNKEIISRDSKDIKVIIRLKHKPEDCMYPHSAFEISVNDIIVDENNYKKILKKKNLTYTNIRSDIRQELTSLIQSGIVDDSLEVEILDEP